MDLRARRTGGGLIVHDVVDGWSADAAEELAAEKGVVLTAEHWKAITCWRELAARSGRLPRLAELKCCGFSIAKLKDLFPGDARAVLSDLAGVPD